MTQIYRRTADKRINAVTVEGPLDIVEHWLGYELVADLLNGAADFTETCDHPDVADELYQYYLATGDMPYGTAKARDGDPQEFIVDQMEKLLDTKVI